MTHSTEFESFLMGITRKKYFSRRKVCSQMGKKGLRCRDELQLLFLMFVRILLVMALGEK